MQTSTRVLASLAVLLGGPTVLAVGRIAQAEPTISSEYAMRWIGEKGDAEGIVKALHATSEPDDPYRVEFWAKETDSDGHRFFFRLRTAKKQLEVTKKVRGADQCPYDCKADEGEQKKEFDVTFFRDSNDPATLTSQHVCSTSCERTYAVRPDAVTSAQPCGGAVVARWKVTLESGKARLERWDRGDQILWELSAKGDKLTEAAFAGAGQTLLSTGIRPLDVSKRDWTCKEASP